MNQSELKELLHYDLDTGVFTWLVRVPRTRFSGCVAGFECQGYRRIKIRKKRYTAHRLAWLYVTGNWPEDEIDHINGDGEDNRFANLREADRFVNARNMPLSSVNKSGVVGVRLRKRKKSQSWVVQIADKGVKIHLGCFKSKNDAIKARKAAEKRLGYHPNHGRGIVAL